MDSHIKEHHWLILTVWWLYTNENIGKIWRSERKGCEYFLHTAIKKRLVQSDVTQLKKKTKKITDQSEYWGLLLLKEVFEELPQMYLFCFCYLVMDGAGTEYEPGLR